MKTIKQIGISCLLTVLVGCGGDERDVSPEADLQANMEKWQSHNIDDYQVNYRVSCFCMREVTSEKTLHVTDGAITEAYYLDSGEALPAGELFDSLLTVEEAFELIQSLKAQSPAELQVTYDDTYGYPTSIHVDRIRGAADDEQSWFFDELM